MKILITLIASAFVSCGFSQDSATVLFIGNSYTSVNNMPSIVESIANSLGDDLTYDSQLQGGATFEVHAGNAATYTKISSDDWDFVVLQAQSQEPSFPESQVNSETLPYAEQMADSVYANDNCSEVLYFMTWGRENGDPQWGPISTFEGMNERLRSAYIRMADSTQGSVSPVGSAWKYVRDNHPTIDLYTADGSHPSYEGSYLAACTFYAAIYRKSPVGAPFTGSLSASVANDLQNAAAVTVLPSDSLDLFNLISKTELITADFDYIVNGASVDFTNHSERADSYTWDFGDLNTSTDDSPNHTYAADGNYTVLLIAESDCGIDSVEIEITINVAGLQEDFMNSLNLRYVGNGIYKMSNESMSNMEVLNMAGQKVGAVIDVQNEIYVDISENKFGIYLLRVQVGNELKSIRLPYLAD